MRLSQKIGLGFGATSGVITTLGLITGLSVGTHSKTAVLGGILTIAVADAMSDAFGIHVSEESTNKLSDKEVWKATYTTFLSKFIFAITFIVPPMIMDIMPAMYVSILWGLFLIIAFNYLMAKKEGKKPWTVVKEHFLIAVFVLVSTYMVGRFIDRYISK